MRPLVCVMLACVALAPVSSYTEDLAREKKLAIWMMGAMNKIHEVECKACQNSSWLANNDEVCPIERGNKKFKNCVYGAYNDANCERLECFKGPGDRCKPDETRCLSFYFCDNSTGTCRYFKNQSGVHPRLPTGSVKLNR